MTAMVHRLLRTRKRQLALFVLSVLLLNAAYYTKLDRGLQRETDLNLTRRIIEIRLAENLKEDKGSGCHIPRLDPFAEEVAHFDNKFPEIKCDGQDWVKCYISKCNVIPEVLAITKDVECVYQDIIHETDRKYHMDPPTTVLGGNTYVLEKSDHVKIKCTGTRTSSFLSSTWKGHATGFRTTVERRPVPPGREDSLNVLILAFDSISKNAFIRGMPKSFKYFTETMKGTILNGYNIVGDGTPAAIFPLLTGKTELELPDVRKSKGNNKTVDNKDLIFYKLNNVGYRTAYFEDSPSIGTFQYRFNGFHHQPADHYLFSFLVEMAKCERGKWRLRQSDIDHCIGDTPQYKLMMNLTDQFMQLEDKKFIFTFISDITHNINMISTADGALEEFLQTLVKRQVLEDTLFVIMGDHGPRFGDIRNTYQGKLEGRLPFLGILLPEKLKRGRPDIQSKLEDNVDVLTTPHDLHQTILDVLDLKDYSNPYKVDGADLPRAMSLLAPIPRNRSCSEAGIEPHWCSCLSWQNVSENEPVYRRVVDTFVNYINALTEKFRSQCVLRTLLKIHWVIRQAANERLLSFAGGKDVDGYFGNFNERFKQDVENYQIKVMVAPGQAIFEATLKYVIRDDSFRINSRDISRTNAYGEEPSCLSAKLPHLNPYCYCKNYISPI